MIAIKLYETMPSDDENVLLGIDPSIPASVIFNVDQAPDSTYQVMTNHEYQEYLVSIKDKLSGWKVIQEQHIVNEFT